jgi:hypothetical protein
LVFANFLFAFQFPYISASTEFHFIEFCQIKHASATLMPTDAGRGIMHIYKWAQIYPFHQFTPTLNGNTAVANDEKKISYDKNEK